LAPGAECPPSQIHSLKPHGPGPINMQGGIILEKLQATSLFF